MDSDRIKGQAQAIGGRIESGTGRVADDDLIAEGLARQVAGRTQAFYGQAKDEFRDAVGRATDYAGQAYEQGSRELNHRVEANPLTAILIAGAVGYLLGMMVRRR